MLVLRRTDMNVGGAGAVVSFVVFGLGLVRAFLVYFLFLFLMAVLGDYGGCYGAGRERRNLDSLRGLLDFPHSPAMYDLHNN